MSNSCLISRLSIIGVGLIGGSLAMSLKHAGKVRHVIGVGRSKANLETALKMGVIDEVISDPLDAARRSDVIVLATPVNTVVDLLPMIGPAINDEKIVTDVGSVKSTIVEAAQATLKERFDRFIPGHPIAGREKSGVTAATADLFENHKVVLTPTSESDHGAYTAIRNMWLATGADVKVMDIKTHDRVLSITSHLPHVLAYAMMDFLATSDDKTDCYEMAAGGFYDFTRTASSDPEMWRAISLMNSAQLLPHLEAFQLKLDAIKELIEQGDGAAIESLFANAKRARAKVTERRKR